MASSSQLDKAKNRLDSLLKQHSSSSLTDDASVMGRQQKIEDMRKRVELQLAAMVQGGGSEFDKLRQQVAELRTNPEDVDDDEETTVSEFLKLNQIGSATSPTHTTTTTRTTTTPATTTTTSLLQTNNNNNNTGGVAKEEDDEEDSVYVENTLITDPYGDAGEYSGDVLLLATNKPHGVGTMKYQDGRTYSGGWHNGQWHGKGIAIFSNGDQFDGTYDLDRRHGFGTYQWKDGRVYEGEFHCDQRQGCGEYRWPDGAVYRGEFLGGHREGEGTYTFADGSQYTGEWSKGRYHGVGQCTWKDGRVYKGEWKEGKAHGFGVEKRSNGTIRHEGMWEHDHPVRK